ncbi:MAG: hypothetical protein P8L79_02190 [Rhodospirillaceae bacterium]|nr:hypothetical protein [Rhodospirillaceae bacterium]
MAAASASPPGPKIAPAAPTVVSPSAVRLPMDALVPVVFIDVIGAIP